MVQSHALREVFENQRWSEFVFGKPVRTENAWMLQRFEELKLPQRCSLDHLAVFFGGSLADQIDANPPFHFLQFDVRRLPVLEARSFHQQVVQDKVADLARFLRRANTGVFHGLADGPGERTINTALGIRIQAGTLAAHQRRHDAWPLRLVACGVAVPEADFVSRVAGQIALDLLGRAENQGFDERQASPQLFDGLLTLQQRPQLFGFAIGGNGRIIVGELATLVLPGPRACVAAENARTALDLDQENSDRSQHEEVHLVDAAVVRDEFEVGPHAVRISLGEPLANEFQRVQFPGERRLGDGGPVVR